MRLAVDIMVVLAGCAVAGCGSPLVDSGRRMPTVPPSQPTANAATSAGKIAATPTGWGDVPHIPLNQIVPKGSSDHPALYHQVQAGETLSDIAALYGVTVGRIVKANGFDSASTVVPGQSIYIPREK